MVPSRNKKFTNEGFMSDLIANVSFLDVNNVAYDVFDHIFMALLDKHGPVRLKYVRANEGPFMNKTLRKAIMLRSKLKKQV